MNTVVQAMRQFNEKEYFSDPLGSVTSALHFIRLDALALSVIATATWLAGWVAGWLSHSGIVSKPLKYRKTFSTI